MNLTILYYHPGSSASFTAVKIYAACAIDDLKTIELDVIGAYLYANIRHI